MVPRPYGLREARVKACSLMNDRLHPALTPRGYAFRHMRLRGARHPMPASPPPRPAMPRVLLALSSCLMLWIASLAAHAGNPPPPPALDDSDLAAIRAVQDAYRDGWLRGDPERVMGTLTPDATLLPSGLTAIRGERGIRAFWWPAGMPPTKVLSMDVTLDDIRGDGNIAYASGTLALAFEWDDAGTTRTTTSESSFLDVLRKGPDGRWRIDARMWSNRSR